jgi:hypothetical protein
MMDAQTLLWVLSSGAGSALIGGAVAWWWQGRAIKALRGRLDACEASRVTAVERSRQARGQINQLQQALAAARAELAARDEDRQRREQVARRLDEAPMLVLPKAELPANGFADTLPIA